MSAGKVRPPPPWMWTSVKSPCSHEGTIILSYNRIIIYMYHTHNINMNNIMNYNIIYYYNSDCRQPFLCFSNCIVFMHCCAGGHS